MPQMRLRPIGMELRPLLQPQPGQQHLLKDQAEHSVPMPRCDLIRRRGAPVFTAHVEFGVAEMRHQLGEVVCYCGHVVAAVWMGGVSDAAHVGCDDGVVGREEW